jgi:hypothetical protein
MYAFTDGIDNVNVLNEFFASVFTKDGSVVQELNEES